MKEGWYFVRESGDWFDDAEQKWTHSAPVARPFFCSQLGRTVDSILPPTNSELQIPQGRPVSAPGRVTTRGKSWGDFGKAKAIIDRDAAEMGLVVLTEGDLGGARTDLTGLGTFTIADEAALDAQRRRLPSAIIGYSLIWYNAQFYQLRTDRAGGPFLKIPDWALKGQEGGVGFDGRLIDFKALRTPIINAAEQVARRGLAVMMDWCGTRQGDGHLEIMQGVREVCNRHGQEFIANISEGDVKEWMDKVIHLPTTLDFEQILERIGNTADVQAWLQKFSRASNAQKIYFRAWLDHSDNPNLEKAQKIADDYRGAVDFLQIMSSRKPDGSNQVENDDAILFHPAL